MRLFVAVWPPAEVLDTLAALDRPAVAGVRWTAPAQWHVTLRFLGEVDDGAVDDVLAALAAGASGLTPTPVVLGDRLAAFGPSVLHAPVDGLVAWALAAGETGPAPFVGHVTVARGKRGRGAARGDVRSLVGRPLPRGPRAWVATSFTLVRSDLGHDGARYTTLASFDVGDHPHTNVRSQLR